MEGRTKNADGEYDVFLLIGQSNMAGRGAILDSDKGVMDGVFILNDKEEIVPAENPLNIYSSIRKKASMQKMNPGATFARDIHKVTGRKILLVVNARGGTTACQWLKNGSFESAKEHDDIYDPGVQLPSFYDEAVRRAKIAQSYGAIKGILWHQGEGDAGKDDAPFWLDKVASMVADLRCDLELGEDVPFIAGETVYNFKNAGNINPEIRKVPLKIPNSGWVSAEGCGSNSDNLHFSRQGTMLLGHRYASKILQMVYGFSAEDATKICSD